MISNENRTHFGVMKDDDGDCEDSVSRAFSQSHLGPHALPNLVSLKSKRAVVFVTLLMANNFF